MARLACEMGPRTEGGKEATLKVALSTLGLVRCAAALLRSHRHRPLAACLQCSWGLPVLLPHRCRTAASPPARPSPTPFTLILLQAYAKYCKDMAGSEPTCPQVELAEGSVRLPPLPPLVNGPPPGQPQQEEGCRGSEQPPEPGAEEAAAPAPVQQAAAADASVSVSSGGSGPLKRASVAQPGGWGTSALGRPTSMAGVRDCAGVAGLEHWTGRLHQCGCRAC